MHSRLGRRPPAERRTNRFRNIALLYAAYRVQLSMLPGSTPLWRQMLTSVGLDPDDGREDAVSPVGIGNRAGNAVIAARLFDGMNQTGTEGGRTYNPQPYADCTGYRPVNTAYQLRDSSRWQPLFVAAGNGVFRIQQFVTPHLARTRPYSYPPVLVPAVGA